MTNLTPEQALQRYIVKLGEKRGKFVKALENDLFNLRHRFEVYCAFFGTNKERVDLLNSISGDCAYWIENSMFECLILNICRMTDPVEMRGKRNVTIVDLPNLLSAGEDSVLKTKLQEAAETSQFARDWRNRRIAHTDEQVRLGKATLVGASRLKLRTAIDSIAACVRRFALVEMETDLSTHPIRLLGDDEVDFLTALYFGKERQQQIEAQRQDFIRRGEWDKIDAIETLPDWLMYRPDEPNEV